MTVNSVNGLGRTAVKQSLGYLGYYRSTSSGSTGCRYCHSCPALRGRCGTTFEFKNPSQGNGARFTLHLAELECPHDLAIQDRQAVLCTYSSWTSWQLV